MEHGGEDVAIEHARDRNTFRGRNYARDFLNGGGKSFAMMRPRATE
jgi:hypothetical protein